MKILGRVSQKWIKLIYVGTSWRNFQDCWSLWILPKQKFWISREIRSTAVATINGWSLGWSLLGGNLINSEGIMCHSPNWLNGKSVLHTEWRRLLQWSTIPAERDTRCCHSNISSESSPSYRSDRVASQKISRKNPRSFQTASFRSWRMRGWGYDLRCFHIILRRRPWKSRRNLEPTGTQSLRDMLSLERFPPGRSDHGQHRNKHHAEQACVVYSESEFPEERILHRGIFNGIRSGYKEE